MKKLKKKLELIQILNNFSKAYSIGLKDLMSSQVEDCNKIKSVIENYVTIGRFCSSEGLRLIGECKELVIDLYKDGLIEFSSKQDFIDKLDCLEKSTEEDEDFYKLLENLHSKL